MKNKNISPRDPLCDLKIGTIGAIGTMGTIKNGKKIMKMGYRNFKTQEIWLFEENFMGVE